MPSFTDIFGGATLYPSGQTYLSLTFSVDQTLAWPIEQSISGNVVSSIMDLNATATGLNVDIPDARQVSNGVTSVFNNVGSNTVTVRDAAGGTIISLASGEAWLVYLSDNTTLAGTWRVFQLGASVASASASALAGAGLKAIATTLNQTMPPTSTAVTPITLTDADRALLKIWTGGAGVLNLPTPGTVGSDWFTMVRNSGTGDLTITPPSGVIDGSVTLAMRAGESSFIVTDGTNFFTIGFGQSISSVFDFISINVAGSGDYTLSGVELNRISYKFTGILTGNRSIIVPAAIQQYWVDNSTTGAFTLDVKTAAQITPIQVLQGDRNILYCDGVDVVDAESSTVTFPIVVSQGGTGATTASAARTNLGVPPSTRILTAGGGMTGGGDLSSNRTFDVIAGTGITVNANDIQLDTAHSRNVDHTAVSVLAGTGLSGGGTIAATRTLNVDVASESVQGIVERATQAEVDIGTDATRYVSPATLASAATIFTRIAGSSGAAGDAITWQNLTSDFSTTSITLVVAMTTTGVVAGTWRFKYTLIYQSSNANSGVGFGINHTGTVGEFAARWSHVTTGSSAANGVGENDAANATGQLMEGKSGNTLDVLIGSVSDGVAVINTDVLAVLEGIIVVTGTGSLELKVRVQTSATMKLMADSCLELLKIE